MTRITTQAKMCVLRHVCTTHHRCCMIILCLLVSVSYSVGSWHAPESPHAPTSTLTHTSAPAYANMTASSAPGHTLARHAQTLSHDTSLPRCTVGNRTHIYHPNQLYTNAFPLDIADPSCNYTATVDTPPFAGELVLLGPSDVPQYTYNTAAVTSAWNTTVGYTIWCSQPLRSGTTASTTALPSQSTASAAAAAAEAKSTPVCKDTLILLVHTDTMSCLDNGLAYKVIYGSLTNRTPVLGYTCSLTRALSLTVRGVSIGTQEYDMQADATITGSLELNQDGQLAYQAPGSKDGDDPPTVVVFRLRAWCGAEILCDTTATFNVTAPPPPPPPPKKTVLPSCSKNSNFRVSAGTRLEENMVVDATFDGNPNVLTCRYVIYVLTAEQPYAPTNKLAATMSATNTASAVPASPSARLLASAVSPRGKLEMDLFGHFVYRAPNVDILDIFTVDIFCEDTLVCLSTLTLDVYTPANANRTTPATPPPTCVARRHFRTDPTQTLTETLSVNQWDETTCPGRVYYTLRHPPPLGLLTLQANGSFTYRPDARASNEIYEFSFDMYCSPSRTSVASASASSSARGSRLSDAPQSRRDPPPPSASSEEWMLCRGTAEILLSEYWLAHDVKPFSNSSQLTCRGSCPAPAWSNNTVLSLPTLDVRPTPDEEGIKFTLVTTIGLMTATFPTFEVLNSVPGTFFEPGEYVRTDSAGAQTFPETGFAMHCLSQQGRAGRGMDMYWLPGLTANVSSHANSDGTMGGVGQLGPLYRGGGMSWYRKFGGAHRECDVFADPCHAAPLLHPATRDDALLRAVVATGDSSVHAHDGAKDTTHYESGQSTDDGTREARNLTLGDWRVAIDYCKATWTGTYTFDALRLLNTGATPQSAQQTNPSRRYAQSVVMYAQSVQPHAWEKPGAFDSTVSRHVIGLEHDTVAHARFVVLGVYIKHVLYGWPYASYSDLQEQNWLETKFFTYRTSDTGDDAFGVNVLVFARYSDRKSSPIVGFGWVHQEWSRPTDAACRTCKHAWTTCTLPGLEWTGGGLILHNYTPTSSLCTEDFSYDACPASSLASPTGEERWGRVVLRKGAAVLPRADCVERSGMFFYHRPGFAPTEDCSTRYQNLTLRGVIQGSGMLSPAERGSEGLAVTGRVILNLLHENGKTSAMEVKLNAYNSVVAHVKTNTVVMPQRLEAKKPSRGNSVKLDSNQHDIHNNARASSDEYDHHHHHHIDMNEDDGAFIVNGRKATKNMRNTNHSEHRTKTYTNSDDTEDVPGVFLEMCVLNRSAYIDSADTTTSTSLCLHDGTSDAVREDDYMMFRVRCTTKQCASKLKAHHIRVWCVVDSYDERVLNRALCNDVGDLKVEELYRSHTEPGMLSRRNLAKHTPATRTSEMTFTTADEPNDDVLYKFVLLPKIRILPSFLEVKVEITLNDTTMLAKGEAARVVDVKLRRRIYVHNYRLIHYNIDRTSEYSFSQKLLIFASLIFFSIMIFIVHKIGKSAFSSSDISADSKLDIQMPMIPFSANSVTTTLKNLDDTVDVLICSDDVHTLDVVTSHERANRSDGVSPPQRA